jgi:hydrogenase expression/formation protein HypC
MKVESTEGALATCSYAGGQYRIRIDLVDAEVGDYVLVHTGVAIAKVDEQEAQETLKLLQEIDDINRSLSRPGDDRGPGSGDQA